MDVSLHLNNELDYDVADGSASYSIWIELEPGKASNWYCVLPNVESIARDGRIICRGTSMTNVNYKTIGCYGWFWLVYMRSANVRNQFPLALLFRCQYDVGCP